MYGGCRWHNVTKSTGVRQKGAESQYFTAVLTHRGDNDPSLLEARRSKCPSAQANEVKRWLWESRWVTRSPEFEPPPVNSPSSPAATVPRHQSSACVSTVSQRPSSWRLTFPIDEVCFEDAALGLWESWAVIGPKSFCLNRISKLNKGGIGTAALTLSWSCSNAADDGYWLRSPSTHVFNWTVSNVFINCYFGRHEA